MDRDVLETSLKLGASLESIGLRYDLSVHEVRSAIERFGLPLPHEMRRQQVDAALSEGRRTVERLCRHHGRTEFAIVGSTHRLHCKRCRAEAVARRRRKVKRMLVEEAGGACRLCGYDEHLAALEFHHRDPQTKSFGLAQRGITRSFEEVRREAKKCVLLCANCHAAIEVGAIQLPVKFALDPSEPMDQDCTIV